MVIGYLHASSKDHKRLKMVKLLNLSWVNNCEMLLFSENLTLEKREHFRS